ncbi:coproporphyrinogen III oxidase [Crocosphaera chwakensis CCY0110]|uniref:Coproporphyrinogen III oxidase n=1 Tax=Crocosphaera chwakensis CCY0110 TaxID=391612 RepID=A3IJ74_9CHRO|nr:coproporphyrinogen III oxidase [Crocosphaera chwakensis CCY0110]
MLYFKGGQCPPYFLKFRIKIIVTFKNILKVSS